MNMSLNCPSPSLNCPFLLLVEETMKSITLKGKPIARYNQKTLTMKIAATKM